MDESQFPSNSNRKQEKEAEPPVVAQVTTGSVRKRKTPLGRRIVETFVATDGKSVLNYVIGDILVPAAKDMIVDVVKAAIERAILGDGASARRSRSSSGSYVSYDRISSGTRREPPWDRDRERPRMSRRAREMHDFEELIVETREEGNNVLDTLNELIDRYGQATVADLYLLVGIQPQFTDRNYGWRSIRGSAVTRIRGNGYLLDLPRPEPLD